jgi:hypothetical protein
MARANRKVWFPMPISKVRARTRSIKVLPLDVVNSEAITRSVADALEAQGLCFWAQRDGTSVVVPVALYESVCAALGGAE